MASLVNFASGSRAAASNNAILRLPTRMYRGYNVFQCRRGFTMCMSTVRV
jgi:hypothetical protein